MPTPLLRVAFACLLAGGCIGELPDAEGPGPGTPVDEDVSGGADAGPQANVRIAVDPPLTETALNSSTTLTVTLESDGYAGPAALSVSGLPESWSARMLPSPAVVLEADGIATATLEIDVPSNGQAMSAPLVVSADTQVGIRDGFATLAVANELVIAIPDGTADGAHPFPPGIPVRLGATVRFLNSDSTIHRIHSDNGGSGFPHQEGDSGPGESYEVTPTETGGLDYYCHEHGDGTGRGVIVVE